VSSSENGAPPLVESVTHASATNESLDVKNGEQQQRHLEHVEAYDYTTVDAEGKQNQEGSQTRVEQHELHPSLIIQSSEQPEQIAEATATTQQISDDAEAIPAPSSTEISEF
jgi:acyl-coenzyme A thioesterase PaaI-like protein